MSFIVCRLPFDWLYHHRWAGLAGVGLWALADHPNPHVSPVWSVAAKYGELWTRYCARVRYRIIPGVY